MAKKKDNKKDKKGQAAIQTLERAGTPVSSNGKVSAATEAELEAQPKMSRKDFEKELVKLQVELVKMQEWIKATGARVCVVFEGRDTAGKGGVIKGILERTSPRVFRVVALSTPTE